jgi:hypothetical protein
MAHATLRWRAWAIEVASAIASLRTFSPSVPGMSSPVESIGDAAPMRVPGAISAMFAAIVMNVPALAAKPPAGATQTMTGTFASRIVPTMSFIDVRAPPGVLSLITTAAAPSRTAASMPSATYWAIVWSTMPVVGRTTTFGSPAARAEEARPATANASTRLDSRRLM